MDVGLRLKLFRVYANLKQRDIAKGLKVTVNFISMLERGRRDPTLKYLQAFAKLVKVPVALLLWDPHETTADDRETMQLSARIAALMAEYAASLRVVPSTPE